MKLFLVSFLRIHRLRVLCPSRKTHETRKWPRAWLKARDWRGTLARACTPLTKWTARSLVGKYTEKTESQIDLLLRVLLVLGSEGLYLCTEKEGLLALALVTYLRAYISIKHTCDVGSLNYDNIMTPLWILAGARFFEDFYNIKFVARTDSYLDLKSTTALQQSAPIFILCIIGLKFSA